MGDLAAYWPEGGYFELDLSGGPDDPTPLESGAVTPEDIAAYERDMAAAPTEVLSAAEVEGLLRAAAEYMAETGEGVW